MMAARPFSAMDDMMTLRSLAAFAVAVLALAAPAPAKAIYLSRSGDAATLYGTFGPGDETEFAAFLARKNVAPLRVLYLDSLGGGILPAIAIARMVRKAGLTTAVRAASANCDSACTLVFAGGVKRHYIHGEVVAEGFGALSGLGFHPAYLKGDRAHFSLRSEEYVNLVNKVYPEMGAPGAADLVRKGFTSTVYRPGGATCLRLHIATSLAEP